MEKTILEQLNDAKERLSNASTWADAKMVMDEVEMLVRNCHFGAKSKNSYNARIKKHDLPKMVFQESQSFLQPMMAQFFPMGKADLISIVSTVIHEEELAISQTK